MFRQACVNSCLTLLLQFPRSGRLLVFLTMEERRHCIASNRKSDSFSPLDVVLSTGSAKMAFNSCTGFTGLAGFRDRGLVDLSTLGRLVDSLEGIIRCGLGVRGTGAVSNSPNHL